MAMKEFVISEAQTETAVLVGLITQTQDERKTNEYLDELAFLAETAGAEVVKRFTQKLPTAHSVTYVGKGKLEEIRQYIRNEEEEEREVGMVIFDDELSAKQIRNIEAELKVKIDKRMYSDMHRRLLELVYYLPFGYHAEYFYYIMVYSFEEGMLEAFYPKRIATPALEIRAKSKEKEARKKAEREERKRVVDEALKQYEQQKGGESA